MKNLSIVRALSLGLALIALGTVSLQAQTVVYSDNNFSNGQNDFVVNTTGNGTTSINTAAPAGGTDTNSLNLSAPDEASSASAVLTFAPQSTPVTIAFDFQYNTVFNSATDMPDHAENANAFYFTVGSSNGSPVIRDDTFYRYGVGQAGDSLTYATQYGNNSVAYPQTGGEFRYTISLPAAGTTGTATLTLSGLNGQQVLLVNGDRVDSVSTTETVNASDISSIGFNTGFSYADAQANIDISNLTVTAAGTGSAVPEPTEMAYLLVGAASLAIIRRLRGAAQA